MGRSRHGVWICLQTPKLTQFTISLVHEIAQKLIVVRKSGEKLGLRPDSKTQIIIEYNGGKSRKVDIPTILFGYYKYDLKLYVNLRGVFKLEDRRAIAVLPDEK